MNGSWRIHPRKTERADLHRPRSNHGGDVEMDHDTNLELYIEKYFLMGIDGFIHDQTRRRGYMVIRIDTGTKLTDVSICESIPAPSL